MHAIPRILEDAAHSHDFKDFLERMLHSGVEMLDTKKASVFFFDPASHWLRLLTSTSGIEPFELGDDQGVAGQGHAGARETGTGATLFEGERLVHAYASEGGDPSRVLDRLSGILTVSVRLIGEAGLTFCFDLPAQEDGTRELTAEQRERAHALARELQSDPVRNALRRAWVSRCHEGIREAGVLPEQLRQRGAELVASLEGAVEKRSGRKPSAIEVQLVDPRRSVIHSFVSNDLPLGFEDAWTHSLDSNDIQADAWKSCCPEMIVGNDRKRFDQRIFNDRGHLRLTRIWIPLLPFHASLPAFLPRRYEEKEVRNRLAWQNQPAHPEFVARRGIWLSEPPPPGSAYGTLSVSFERDTMDRLELAPWTDELATWCVCEVWRLSRGLYEATLGGVFEEIGRLSFALGAATGMTLVTPGPAPMTLEVREYPYAEGAAWRLARRFQLGGSAVASAELKYSDPAQTSIPPSDVDALRTSTRNLAGEATRLATSLYDHAMDVFAIHDSTRFPTGLLGTEAQDPVVEEVCRAACRESCALSARFYSFDVAAGDPSAASPELLSEPDAWAFAPEGQLTPGELELEKNDALELARGRPEAPAGPGPESPCAASTAGDPNKSPPGSVPAPTDRRPRYVLGRAGRSPAVLLPLEFLDRSIGVLALTFPSNEPLDRRKREDLERRAAHWLQRLSVQRLVLLEGFSSTIARMRQAVAKAKLGPAPAAAPDPEEGPPSAMEPDIREFLGRFCATAARQLAAVRGAGVMLSLHTIPVHDRPAGGEGADKAPLSDALGRLQRALAWLEWPDRDRRDRPELRGLGHETPGTGLTGPCLEATERREIVRWGTDGPARFVEAREAVARDIAAAGTTDAEQARMWLRALPGGSEELTVYTVPLPLRVARVHCRATLTLFLEGRHLLRSFHQSLLSEFGAHLGDVLGVLMEQRQQLLRNRHEQCVEARCRRFASFEGGEDPVGVLLRHLGSGPETPPSPSTASASSDVAYWGLADDAVLWSSGVSQPELVSLASRGKAQALVAEQPLWQRGEHPWCQEHAVQLVPWSGDGWRAEILKERPGLATYDLRAQRGPLAQALHQATAKPWLVSVPIVDAQLRFFGLFDLLRSEPIAPEEYAVLERQLLRLVSEFRAAVERERQRRLRTLELNLHAKAATLLRSYKTAEVHHATVERLREAFHCDRADLFLVGGECMMLAASTACATPISQEERFALGVRGHQRAPASVESSGPAAEGTLDILAEVYASGSRAEPRVSHPSEPQKRAPRGLEGDLRTLLGESVFQERLVVPVFESGDQSGHLIAAFQLAAPRPRHPKGQRRAPSEPGPDEAEQPLLKEERLRLFTAGDAVEAQQVAQFLEPVLRLVRIIDEHGIQVNELVHMLGQPLTALRFAENQLFRLALQEPRPGDAELYDAKDLIDEQYGSVDRAKQRLGFLAQLYRSESGVHWEPTSLALEIRKAIRAIPATTNGAWFHQQLEELPELPLDRAWIGQALVNLFDNAAKYSFQKKRIDVNLTEARDGVITLSVTNRGVGVPRDALSKIFEPYYRVRVPDRMRARKGSGLGLALVREAIERIHDGRISVTSDPDTEASPLGAAGRPAEPVVHLTTFTVVLKRFRLRELARRQEAAQEAAKEPSHD